MIDHVSDLIIKKSAEVSGISTAEIMKGVEFYNADYTQYGNEIYENIFSRVAHWLNFQSEDFFSQRIHHLFSYVETKHNILWIDAGFSVPYLKTNVSLNGRRDIKAILVDKYQSAFDFYEITHEILPDFRKGDDILVKTDLSDQSCIGAILDKVTAVQSHRFSEILISAADVVEHLDDVSIFWDLCQEIKKISNCPVRLYITLPICDSIPSHKLAFATERNALAFIKPHLDIEETIILAPKKDAIDTSFLKSCVCAVGNLKDK